MFAILHGEKGVRTDVYTKRGEREGEREREGEGGREGENGAPRVSGKHLSVIHEGLEGGLSIPTGSIRNEADNSVCVEIM